MAVTSIWPITGNPDGVIEYAINPEKTSEESREETAALHAIDNVLEYTADDLKTEKRMYVSGVNCQIPYAKEQFMELHDSLGKWMAVPATTATSRSGQVRWTRIPPIE